MSMSHLQADYHQPSDSPPSPAARKKRGNRLSKLYKDSDMGRNTNGTPVCRYWKAGYCRNAEGCQFRHTLAPEHQEFEYETFPNTKSPVCSYWDAGDCARGENCRFLHDRTSKIASVDVFQVATCQQLEMAIEKANQEHKRTLDLEKAAHQATEAAAQEIEHQKEVLIATMKNIEQYYEERRAQFEASDHGAGEEAERPQHSLSMENANDHYKLWLAQETLSYERRVAEARENHALALAGADKEYKRRLAEEAVADEIALKEHRRQLQALRIEEAKITEQYAVLGESSLITCRAGIDVQKVVVGFDICRIVIKNLPGDTKHKEISDILVHKGMNILDFFVSDFRVKDRGNRREATVLVITNHGGMIAAGLENIEFRDHTLTVEVSGSLKKKALNICWPVPHTTIIATYKNIIEAERKARELDGKMCKGQRIRAEKKQLLSRSIKLAGFPHGTSEDHVIRTFVGTANIKFMHSYSLEESFATLLDHLRAFPNVNTNINNLISEPVYGKVRVKAYFDNLEDAKRAHDSLDGKHLDSNSPMFQSSLSSLPSAMQYETIVTLRQYEAQKGKWDALSKSMTGSDAHVQINKVENRKTVLVRVFGNDKKAVGSLKVRVEGMVAGERLDSHFWHPSFLTPDGKALFERIYKDKKVHVRIDLKFRALRLYGETNAIEETRRMIKEEINCLARLETTVVLDQKSISFFMRQGLKQLRELIGEENVDLSIMPGRCEITIKGGEEERHHPNRLIRECIMPGRCVITIKGGEEERHHLNRLIRESQVSQIMEQIHPEKDEKVNCPICYDEVSHPEQLGCGHTYCSGCLSHYLASAPETKTFPLVCLGDETACKTPIPLPLIRRFMTPQAFRSLVEAAFRSYLEQHSQELKYCTTPGCQQIYRHSSKARILQCPSCFSSICSACDDEPHKGLTCQERRDQKNSFLQDRLFNAWADGHGKQCPQCRSVVEKNGGCNHMTCRCGAHFCWKCGKNFGAKEIYQHMTDAHGV